jgi:hypothetical protein
MADEMEPMLRNALDAVHRGRKWGLLGMAALFFAITIMLALLFGGAAQRTPAPATFPLKAFYVSSAAVMLLIFCATAVVVMHITRMTRVVLRAIDTMRK